MRDVTSFSDSVWATLQPECYFLDQNSSVGSNEPRPVTNRSHPSSCHCRAPFKRPVGHGREVGRGVQSTRCWKRSYIHLNPEFCLFDCQICLQFSMETDSLSNPYGSIYYMSVTMGMGCDLYNLMDPTKVTTIVHCSEKTTESERLTLPRL